MRLLRALGAAALVVLALLTLGGCATPTGAGRDTPALPRTERERDDLIKAAQQILVERCLAGRGLSSKPAAGERREGGTDDAEDRRLQGALFGRGRTELSVTLATGYTVRAHTDGCLAAAQRELYGDERRWFRAQVVVNNLRAEAGLRLKDDPDHRAAHGRWVHCVTPDHGPRPERPAPAVAARCDRESGLDEVRARLEPALLDQVRAERRDQLTTYRQLRTRALHRAADLYAERTVPENREKGSTPS
ncbi:hypothetical protein O3Q52_09445 [Streptomyces sp. ActVer]|uniref:hypothetical protein n=1 Tax=Streptomyces sp. ActVer TaxID=3014558 RepID=UPI0022B3222F|nr:hypothetical protein [Streptomyces sp. ActVer]MCZ4508423.1 hypothetical protein [Streptomyces sp. ActVer]